MIEHDKIVTHLTKQEKRRLVQLTTDIVRSWMSKEEVDLADVKELRRLQLKRDGWKPEKIEEALAKEANALKTVTEGINNGEAPAPTEVELKQFVEAV